MIEQRSDTVEYDLQPGVELLAVVVARLKDVLDRQLEQVGELGGGKRLHDGPGHGSQLRLVSEGQVDLLQHEAVHVAVDHRDRMGSLEDREATLAEAPDPRLQEPQRGRPWARPRRHQAHGPGVAAQARTGVVGPLADRRPPVRGRHRGLDLGGDDVDQPVENLVLAVDVVVQRGRLDAQLAGESAHRDRFQAFVVRDDQRDLQSAVPGSTAPGWRPRSAYGPWVPPLLLVLGGSAGARPSTI